MLSFLGDAARSLESRNFALANGTRMKLIAARLVDELYLGVPTIFATLLHGARIRADEFSSWKKRRRPASAVSVLCVR